MDACDAFLDETLPHLPALLRAARRHGRDPEDLVQEAFLRAFNARSSYRPGTNARAWLARILHNTAVSEHRKRARERRLRERVAELPERRVEAEAPVRSRELRVAMSRLAPNDRAVVALADLEGRQYRDIARTLGCPIGTVMSRLHRARRRLRRMIEQGSAQEPSRPRPDQL
jgi:RNA polymerase sigma-70 factor (ECF subfamily)